MKGTNFYGKKYIYLVVIDGQLTKIYANSINYVNDYLIKSGLLDYVHTWVQKDNHKESEVKGVYISKIHGEKVVDGEVVKICYKYYRLEEGCMKTAKVIKDFKNYDVIPKYTYKFTWQGKEKTLTGADRKILVEYFKNKGYVYDCDKGGNVNQPTNLELVRNRLSEGVMLIYKGDKEIEVPYTRFSLTEKEREALVRGKFKYEITMNDSTYYLYGDTLQKALSALNNDYDIKSITQTRMFRLQNDAYKFIVKIKFSNGDSKSYAVLRTDGARL